MRSRYIKKTAKKRPFQDIFSKWRKMLSRYAVGNFRFGFSDPNYIKYAKKIAVYPKFQVASFSATRRLDYKARVEFRNGLARRWKLNIEVASPRAWFFGFPVPLLQFRPLRPEFKGSKVRVVFREWIMSAK